MSKIPEYEYKTHFGDNEDLMDPELQTSIDEHLVQLGFIKSKNSENQSLELVFQTKMGGYPAWLIPDQIPKASDVSCGVCKTPLTFLFQIYTPEDDPITAYHRVIYIFICKNGKCLKLDRNKSIMALRVQLPRDNEYYELNEPIFDKKDNEDDNNDDDDDNDNEEEEEIWKLKSNIKKTSLCIICGLNGLFKCSKCHSNHYCSKSHQILDWDLGNHRNLCGLNNNNDQLKVKPFLGFNEKLIECFDEKSSSEMKCETMERVNNLMNGLEIKDNGNEVMIKNDEKYENTKVEVDSQFLIFQRRMEFDPNQVLRYARTEYKELPVEPLWVSSIKPELTDILPCQHCHQPKQFEFQLLPQLLNYIPMDNTSHHALDFATYLIYTCPNSCWPPVSSDQLSPFIAIDSIIHQDFAEDGIGENIRNQHF